MKTQLKPTKNVYGVVLELDNIEVGLRTFTYSRMFRRKVSGEKSEVRIDYKGKKYLMTFKEFVKRLTGKNK